jgi:hypothetical protein
MTKPNNPYNRALSDCNDYARRQLDAVHADITRNIETGGTLAEFHKLCGRRDALADLLYHNVELTQPE